MDELQGSLNAAHEVGLLRLREQVQNDFGVAGRTKDRALRFQTAFERSRIHQRAVVGKRDFAVRVANQERLRHCANRRRQQVA